jgi:hypothetical protein
MAPAARAKNDRRVRGLSAGLTLSLGMSTAPELMIPDEMLLGCLRVPRVPMFVS